MGQLVLHYRDFDDNLYPCNEHPLSYFVERDVGVKLSCALCDTTIELESTDPFYVLQFERDGGVWLMELKYTSGGRLKSRRGVRQVGKWLKL